MWAVLAQLDDALQEPSSPHSDADGSRSPARDVVDRCAEVQELLRDLRSLDLESVESHWASTDYLALSSELVNLQARARSKLTGSAVDTVKVTPEVEAFPEEQATLETALEKLPGSQGQVKVRLVDVSDLEDYPCDWAGGMCQHGCTVSGCMRKELAFYSEANNEELPSLEALQAAKDIYYDLSGQREADVWIAS